MLTITIDWLAGTFHGRSKHETEFINKYASCPTIQDAANRHGYTSARVDGNGVQLLWNANREEMGTHIVLPGSSLRKLQENAGVQLEALLRDAANAQLAFSRIDLAKDCTGQAIDLETVYQSLVGGRNEGTARTFGKIQSNDGGFTIYVGSRQSEKFIRIYNKAAQEGLANEHWYRYELETKGMVSRALATSLIQSGHWDGVFDAVSLSMLELGQSSPLAAFYTQDGISIGIPKIERTSDRERWIASQVIPAVSKHYSEHPDSDAIERLLAILTFMKQSQLLH
jgi:hypothetical protein